MLQPRLPSRACPVQRRQLARQLAALAALGASLIALVGACASDEAGFAGVASARLRQLRERGRLVCGINGQLPGFSVITSSGRYTGLDVDVCRAVAAAALGDPGKLELRPLNLTDRFAALASGDVDLLSRNTTITLSRDATGGNALRFAPVVFHDGGGIMAPVRGPVRALRSLAGQTVCVLTGSSNESVLADRLRQLSLPYTALRFQTADQAFTAYRSGRCAAIVSDRAGLAAQRSRLPDPAAHRILPELLSKEPQAPATIQADPAWADAVRWVVYALIEAEERGITQANVKQRLAAA
ncbi:MAG: amino acid ABC transporter substrate-binding protein, partial [Synechococcaceae cyanobacterium]|nr:amino acid ABC transporter substrate-binding protein [Synechococcaceae cyanobacterium]